MENLIKEIKKELVELRDCSVRISAINEKNFLLDIYKHEPELTINDDAWALDSNNTVSTQTDAVSQSAMDVMEANVSGVVSSKTDADTQVKKNGNNRKPPAQCEICFKMFTRVSALKLHLETHNSDRPYFECDVCSKKIIASKSRFILHFLSSHCDDAHAAVRKFECHVCLKRFCERIVLKSHMQIHLREPVTCKLCSRVFRSQKWLNFHLRFNDHKKHETLYSCDFCGKTTRTKQTLKYHLFTHLTEKNFQCKICFRKFKTGKLMRKHIRRMNHTDEAKVTFKCSFCPKIFSTKAAFDGHFNIHFDGKQYTCHICPKKYARSNKLKPHLIKNHIEPIMRFKCELCSEIFPFEVTLKTHLLTHLNTPVVHNCVHCAETFSNAKELRVHGISHRPQLKCDLCYRSFRLQIMMNKHIEIHDEILYKNDDKLNGKREYHCDICVDRTFSTKIAIWKHLRSHFVRNVSTNPK